MIDTKIEIDRATMRRMEEDAAARLQRRQHGVEVLFDEQHGVDDQIAAGDVVMAALQCGFVVGPFGGRVHGQHQTRHFTRQTNRRALGGAGQMVVHGHDHDAHRRRSRARFSGCSELWHRRAPRR